MKPHTAQLKGQIRLALQGFAVSEPLSLSEWATRHFYLSADSSQTAGRWEPYPYQTTIMDLVSHDAVQLVAIQKPARVGFTKILVAATGYFAEHKGRNQALWQPTDDDSDDFCKTEIEPMLRDVEIMKNVFESGDSKNPENTLRMKTFRRSRLYLRGGKSAKNFRRITVAVAMIDEVDKFDRNIEKAGDPISLAKKRLEGATFPKLIIGSTALLKGLSHIENAVAACEIAVNFQIPCPHCAVEHPLTWGAKEESHGFKWVSGRPSTVRHQCPHCGSLVTQAEYLIAAKKGRWKSTDGCWFAESAQLMGANGEPMPMPKSVGIRMWTGYSPQVTWAELVEEYLAAHKAFESGRPEKMISFTNETLGETWEVKHDTNDPEELKARAEGYTTGTVPEKVSYLLAGVDVQGDRWEVVTWGFGRGLEAFVVDYMVIRGNPALMDDWKALGDYLDAKFPRVGGGEIGITASAVDTGGHFTHQSYVFCRSRMAKKTFAIKGDSHNSKKMVARQPAAVDVNYNGKVIRSGVKLHFVGTDTAKDLLASMLTITKDGPGKVHFPQGLADAFYIGLCAEARELVQTAKGEDYRWIKIEDRNEPLDCTVYAFYLAEFLNLITQPEHVWANRENELASLKTAMSQLVRKQTIQPSQPRQSPFASPDWLQRR